ncbi:Glycosyl transferase, family 2 domain protein, partial [mine drainage metagenome]
GHTHHVPVPSRNARHEPVCGEADPREVGALVLAPMGEGVEGVGADEPRSGPILGEPIPEQDFPPHCNEWSRTPMNQEDGLSIILPVLNERENVQPLLDRLAPLSRTTPIEEVVFVDDGSTDGTVEFLRQASCGGHSYVITVISRTKRMGQVDACIAGARAARCNTIVVMDADHQHSPR